MGENARLQAVVGRMNKLAEHPTEIWSGYRPEQSTYIFVVDALDGATCAIVWSGGATRPAEALRAQPRLLTPMFGFHVTGPQTRDDADAGIWLRWSQPAAVAEQLEALNIHKAVLIPLSPKIRLPFEWTDLHLFDIAVHEGFHANVQAPVWLKTSRKHRWPLWDQPPPQRSDLVARCYVPAESADTERGLLLDAAVGALSGAAEGTVCAAAKSFIEARRARWTRLGPVRVPAAAEASSPPLQVRGMSCEMAEAVMELDEGVPEFVSWLTALQTGNVGLDRLKQRFAAKQPELFYLTGSMELVVLRRLAGEAFGALTRDIAASESWDSGNLFGRFEAEVQRRCR